MTGAATTTSPADSLRGLRSDLDDVLLRVEGLTKTFLSRGSRLGREPGLEVHAVADLSFDVRRGETF